jgi:CRISPR/Cas system CMR-associated protein Cmr5 small subunit
MTSRPTLDQRRAQDAWTFIEAIRSRPEAERKDIVRAAKKLPVRIITAGLGHALQFVKAKNKASDLLTHLSGWSLERRSPPAAGGAPTPAPTPAPTSTGGAGSRLTLKSPTPAQSAQRAGSGGPSAAKPPQIPPDLMAAIRNGTSDDLRRHTAEVLAWLAWFNRFAEGEFPKDSQDDGGDS